MTGEKCEQIEMILSDYIGKKITLIGLSEFGIGAYNVYGKLEKIEIERYAQYDYSLLLWIKPKKNEIIKRISFLWK